MISLKHQFWLGSIGLLCPLWVTAQAPDLMLAKSYHQDVEISTYLVSEKYDGMRTYWTGSKLITRNGHVIHAPKWFIEHLPSQPLDGELWLGRGQFQQLMQVVRDKVPEHEAWARVQFMVFDLPRSLNPFYVRLQQLQQLVQQLQQPHVIAVPHHRFASHAEVKQWLMQVQQAGGEGLMLKRYDAPYLVGRSPLLLKMKAYQDGEATVLAYLPGKGKYTGLMGALLVRDAQGRQFKIGSGFSDAQRQTPPAIGSVITYRFNGYTDRGLPRFARFDREYPAL